MRDFINLSEIESEELNSQFPYILDLLNCENTDSYYQASICPFDRFLFSEDASKLIDSVSENEAKIHNMNLHNFIVTLGRKTRLLSIKLFGRKKEKIKFRRFASDDALIRKTKLKHHMAPNSNRLSLLAPELGLVYFENWDFTHHIFSKKKLKIELLEELASKNNLYLIK